MKISRKEFIAILGAGAAAGVSGHYFGDDLPGLFGNAPPKFLQYVNQKPRDLALDDAISYKAPTLLGTNDIYWLVTKAYMGMVAACEGTLVMGQPSPISPYRMSFGGKEISSLADHPRQRHRFWDKKNNKWAYTTAEGAFQILEDIWDTLHRLHDFWYPGEKFSAGNQELAFCYLHSETGGSARLMDGVKVLHQHITVSFDAFKAAVLSDGSVWAALPFSSIGIPTGQSSKPLWKAWTWFNWALWRQCGYCRSITHPINPDNQLSLQQLQALRSDTMRWREKKNRMHYGEDYAVAKGTPIHAPEDGVISLVDYDAGAGHIVCFVPDGYPELEIISFHCTGEFPVAQGNKVKRRDVIGFTGDSGIGTGEHWHVGVTINGVHIDPRWYLGMAHWFA